MRFVKHLLLAILAVSAFMLGGCGDDETIIIVPYSGKFVYVNNNADTANYVSGFAIRANGTLAELAGSPFITGGAGNEITYFATNPIAIARTKKLLFAANKGDDTISVFSISSVTGELTAVGLPVASGGDLFESGSLAVDDAENFLFVANDDGAGVGSISVFAIGASGTLTPVLGSPFALGLTSADGITLNPVGDTLYVAAPTANEIVVLDIAIDGTLSHIAGSPFAYPADGQITSFVLSSSTVGLSAATSGNLTSYNIDSNGVPILLDSLALGGNYQAITTTRKGSLAVMAGGYTSSISMVNVASNGVLSLVPGSPFATATITSGYALANPSGRLLFATEATQLESFSIDSVGALSSIATYPLTNPGFATGLVIY